MSSDLEQGTAAWRLARCGSLGASQVADALARTKTGWGASRANVLGQLVAERLTGTPIETYSNAAMQRGNEVEPEARAAYQFERGILVASVGIIKHPTIVGTHASPDGLVGPDGLVEIKCPNISTHIDTLLGQSVAGKYMTQMQWQMACTGRAWCDFASFDPRMPEAMRLFVRRVPRDDKIIAELECAVVEFLGELDAKVAALTSKYSVELKAA